LQCPKERSSSASFQSQALFQSIRFIDFITLALVNVKLLDEFCLSFLLYALPRVELPIAMLT